MSNFGWILSGVGAVGAVALTVYWQISLRRRRNLLNAARDEFHLRREWLEAKFVTLATKSAPRGLEWGDCEFDDRVRFARDPEKDELCAFVGVTIKFEAIDDGGMEDVEAVANFKAATGVFHYRNGEWVTLGRAIFNLNPHETIMHYHLEHVE
jgi:hypothetical protein